MNLTKETEFFQKNLLAWAATTPRPMPWKGVRDPYRIWLSEIILQQTRVEQGRAFYERILVACPDVFALAALPEDELMKLWEGLGYYSRARNLQSAAKFIATHLNGKFPEKFEEILQLKGVGEYTASAIASFAYDLPYAVLDGNVYRVLSRFFGIETPIDSPAGKTQFSKLAAATLIHSAPAKYNQAIMDFGALQCTPRKPDCPTCPMQQKCAAFTGKKVGLLPVKGKKLVKSRRFFHYFIFRKAENTWIRKREEKDIWKHLYEFPLIESVTNGESPGDLLLQHGEKIFAGADYETAEIRSSEIYTWQLTHRTIEVRFHELLFVNSSLELADDFTQIKLTELKNYAFPRVIDRYLREKNYL